MSELLTDKPLSYSPSRAKQFVKRATHAANYSREYKPDLDASDYDSFSDAMIGFFLEAEERSVLGIEEENREGYRASILAQAALAIDFLTGRPLVEMQRNYTGVITHLKNEDKNTITELALSVAKVGAQTASSTIDSNFEPPKSKHEGKNKTWNEESTPPVDTFTDLTNLILDLYHQMKKVSPKTAGALLFLFKLREASAPRETQVRVYGEIVRELDKRLRLRSMNELKNGDKFADHTFAKGRAYLQTVIKTPFKDWEVASPIETLVNSELNFAKPSERQERTEDIRNQVVGHIGYVIAKLY